MTNDIEVVLDLDSVHRNAERTRDRLLDLRRRFDLARFEYTRRVRIAPLEIPHSHPTLTLNGFARDDLGVLTTYLHEQMHWYVVWYSHIEAVQWHEIWRALRARYPDVPAGKPEGAADAFSVYLHLIVNWLEVDVASQFIEREKVVTHVCGLPFYRWMYRTVIEDWDWLGKLYADQGLIPVRFATDMSADDLELARRGGVPPT
jgi:hypothetical protein